MERDFERYWYRDIRQIDSLKQMLTESAELFADRPAFWVKREKGQPYEAISYQLMGSTACIVCDTVLSSAQHNPPGPEEINRSGNGYPECRSAA